MTNASFTADATTPFNHQHCGQQAFFVRSSNQPGYGLLLWVSVLLLPLIRTVAENGFEATELRDGLMFIIHHNHSPIG